ncbi:MAG: hypothetical protein HC780_14010 [Leptolyngbyaceae cyanobacterium CSU_1_3]|nr:hypothetical protein [Leptolyngbyaceae cyanobacterium CSU_1_3]
MAAFPTAEELAQFRQSPAADLATLQLLEQTQDFEATFNQIYVDRYGEPRSFGEQRSLWQILLTRIQQEICGENDSLRSLIQAAKKILAMPR